jgi:hypothetical protein
MDKRESVNGLPRTKRYKRGEIILSGKKKYELSKRKVIDKWATNYPKVMTWLSKVQRKENYAWFLWLYCKTVGKNPDQLLALKVNPQSREAEHLLDGFIANTDFKNSIKVGTMVAVRSFYKWNYADLASKAGQIEFIKQKPYRKHSKEELLKIYRSAQNVRDRALITFTWSTAIAKESLSKLKWKYLDANWQTEEIPHIGLPSEIIKGHGIGKYRGVEQHSFLTPEAKKDLLDYYDWLTRVKGVVLKPEDAIFLEVNAPYKPLRYEALSKIAFQLSRWSGVPFGWHDARRYVETALEETKINPNWARKIRGRKVRGEEAPYSRPAIEQLRNAYREAVPLLEFTQPTSLMELKERQEIVEQLNAKMIAGEALNEKDKANMKRYGIPIPLFRKKAIKPEDVRSKNKNQTNGGDCGENFEQIAESQLLSYLKAGWSIVKELQSGELIVKR